MSRLGILGANGIVGGGLGIAAGSAFTAKREGKGRVSVAFFGDGAVNQGIWYETANMAVLWKLPLIYVCENNQYTEFTNWKKLVSGKGLAARAEAMGMRGVEVDGNDVLAVHSAALELVEAPALARVRLLWYARLSVTGDITSVNPALPTARRKRWMHGEPGMPS